MTHDAAVRMIRGKTNKTSRKIGNNTIGVIHDNGDVGIILHSTQVVTIFSDGSYMLYSGGWRTLTTKDRMNTYSPFSVTQRKGEWFVSYWDGETHHEIEYFDHMRISRDMFNQLVTA